MIRAGHLRILAALVAVLGQTPALAQDTGSTADADAAVQGEAGAGSTTPGSATNLPVPRFVSLKTSEGNVRRGPSLEHRIDWVFTRRNLPLRITAEFDQWRRVEDSDGQGGWIHYSLLSGVRTVLVTEAKTELHLGPDQKTLVTAIAEAGVVGKLGACRRDWCEISADGEEGWVEKIRLWGVEATELRE